MVNILLVEDDEVDVMNVRRAFRRTTFGTPLWVSTPPWSCSRGWAIPTRPWS